MKKTFTLLMIIFIICVLSACNPCDTKNSSLTVYDIIIDLDTDNGTLNCYQEVLYTNNTGDNLNELKFNLYPNAYRENAIYKAIGDKYISDAYYNGESFGNIEILSVKHKGKIIPFTVNGIDKNILTVTLPDMLKNKGETAIQLEYAVTIPKTNSRFGITKTGINCGNFYPILCVYEKGGWITEPYYNIGDPFYSETANYLIELNVNGNGILATTGNTIDEYTKNGIHTKIIEALKVRDFAFVYLENGKKITERIDGIDVNYFYTSDDNPDISLKTAVSSIKIFNESFGKYPYKSYNVVDTDFIFGGMEYPNLVFINCDLKDCQREYTIAHETAHQWWYGVVGSNSIDNAWLDEGLTEFSSAFYFKKTNRDNLYCAFIQASHINYINTEKSFKKAGKDFDGIMAKPLSAFPNENSYVVTAYDKGQIMFASMYELIGEKNFLKALRNYYNTYKYQNATPEDLLSCFRPENRHLFNLWIEGRVIIPPAI